ncbi:alpha/beta hydrolase [Chondromyces apiculatus]|nr:dienelactone hydrolase family protein [Chondromyces apiculatus]
MTTATTGPLKVHALGGSDRRGGGDGPAILLCHGFGAPGDDLVSLARVIDAGAGVRWFFPEAPLTVSLGYGISGRAWWQLDLALLQQLAMEGHARDLSQETPPGMAEAREALERCIATLEADHGVVRERLVIGGFSQGGMITTEVALHAEKPFAGLAVLSGTLVCEDRWKPAAERRAPGMKVLVSHGRADPILPFHGADALRNMLTKAGADVEWVPHGGQHEIPTVVVQRLAAFARKCFVTGER